MNKKAGAFLVRGSAVLVLLTFLACNIKCTRNQITNIQSQNAKNCEDKKEETQKLQDSIVKLNDMLELLKEYSQVHIEISDSSSNSGNVIVGHDNTIIVNNLDTNKAVIKAASQKVNNKQERAQQTRDQNQVDDTVKPQYVSAVIRLNYKKSIERRY